MTNVSMSLVCMLYNLQLIKYAEGYGIKAYGTLMYVNFIFISLFIGYTVAAAPIIAYNFGAQNHKELRNVLKKSLVIIGVISVIMFLSAEVLATPMSYLFANYDSFLLEKTKEAFFYCSFAFLFSGFAIFGSSFFTALNNGPISAAISFLRTLVFQSAAVYILPLLFSNSDNKVRGIWLSIVVAEALAVIVTGIFLLAKRKKYNY